MPGKPIIRPVGEQDAAGIAAIYTPNVTENVISFEMVPPDAAEMARRIVATTTVYPWLVCEREGELLGYVYAGTHNARAAYQWSVNVTVYVSTACRRGGVGRALYVSLFELLRLQGFFNAYAGITLPNAGSVGIHEAMGFRLIGVYREVGFKFGAWHDVGWWGLPLREKPSAEPPPAARTRRSTGPLWVALCIGSRAASAPGLNRPRLTREGNCQIQPRRKGHRNAGQLNPFRWPIQNS